MSLGAGVQFNADGPIMSGTWYNPQTGHKFTVRDCFFEDGNFIVMGMDGQRYDYNTIQNYIQCNDADGKSIEPDASVMAPRAQQTKSQLPPEVAGILAPDGQDDYNDLMLPEDEAVINPLTKGLGNLNDSRHIAPASEHQAPGPIHTTGYMQVVDDTTEDMRMIDRVLRRHPVPEFDAVLNWACPEKQIETLVDVLGIEPGLIAEYYVNKLDKDAIFAGIKAKLAAYINSQWGPKITTSATTVDPTYLDDNGIPVLRDEPKPKTIRKTTPKKKK